MPLSLSGMLLNVSHCTHALCQVSWICLPIDDMPGAFTVRSDKLVSALIHIQYIPQDDLQNVVFMHLA